LSPGRSRCRRHSGGDEPRPPSGADRARVPRRKRLRRLAATQGCVCHRRGRITEPARSKRQCAPRIPTGGEELPRTAARRAVRSEAGAGRSLESLARQRYDVIFIGEVQSPLDIGAIVAAARKFPQQKIVLIDPPFVRRWPKNVQGPIWRVEEPAYLAGYLAGLMERRRPGQHVVGSVGGYSIPSVNAFIAGFQAGAKKADPGVRTVRRYTLDFFNTDKCRSVALNEIAKGAGVLFNVAGGLRARDAPGGQGEARVGRGRRRRPVVLGPRDTDERPEALRRAGLHDDQSARRRPAEDRDERGLEPPQRRGRAREDQPEGASGLRASGREDSQADRGREDQGSGGAQLGVGAWIVTQTAPSPTATPVSCCPSGILATR
jgi:ABC transporter substrate-binding protein PnrA-like